MTTPQGMLELAEALRTAFRRLGGIPALARSEGGAEKIIEICVKEFAALRLSASPAGNGGRAAQQWNPQEREEVHTAIFGTDGNGAGTVCVNLGPYVRSVVIALQDAEALIAAHEPDLIFGDGPYTSSDPIDQARRLTPAVAPDGAREIENIIVDNLNLDWHGREAAETTREAVRKTAKQIVALASQQPVES